MDKYRILSLDGGGTWALIEVMALIDLYGGSTTGHQVLSDFDMVAANSGGSIVLGGLVDDMKLDDLLSFFLSQQKRDSVFVAKWHLWNTPKYRSASSPGLKPPCRIAAACSCRRLCSTSPAPQAASRYICLSSDSITTATARDFSARPRRLLQTLATAIPPRCASWMQSTHRPPRR